VALEFHEPDTAEAQLPQRARGMQQIHMRGQLWRGDRARHRETVLKQRPVERFPVEGDKHGPLRNVCCQFLQQRIFFREIAHEELFDLQPSGIPPRNANEKRVRAGSACEARRFRIEKQPS